MTGSAIEVWTNATMSADCPMEIISQAAPTDWISAPKLARVLANQTARNTGKRMGDSAVGSAGDASIRSIDAVYRGAKAIVKAAAYNHAGIVRRPG